MQFVDQGCGNNVESGGKDSGTAGQPQAALQQPDATTSRDDPRSDTSSTQRTGRHDIFKGVLGFPFRAFASFLCSLIGAVIAVLLWLLVGFLFDVYGVLWHVGGLVAVGELYREGGLALLAQRGVPAGTVMFIWSLPITLVCGACISSFALLEMIWRLKSVPGTLLVGALLGSANMAIFYKAVEMALFEDATSRSLLLLWALPGAVIGAILAYPTAICVRIRRAQHVHSWVRCRCSECSATRDAEHDWKGCLCSICGKDKHQWQDCRCVSCGAQRKLGHRWTADKCALCGEPIPDCAEIPAKLAADRAATSASMMKVMLAGSLGKSPDAEVCCPRCGDRHLREPNRLPVRRYSTVDVALLSDVGAVSVVQCPACGVTYEVIP